MDLLIERPNLLRRIAARRPKSKPKNRAEVQVTGTIANALLALELGARSQGVTAPELLLLTTGQRSTVKRQQFLRLLRMLEHLGRMRSERGFIVQAVPGPQPVVFFTIPSRELHPLADILASATSSQGDSTSR